MANPEPGPSHVRRVRGGDAAPAIPHWLSCRVISTAGQLASTHGVDPTPEAIARRAGVNVKLVRRILRQQTAS